jgi:hypothetical protein
MNFDEKGETLCPRCKGVKPETCLFCKGYGKVDWIELLTGGKKIKVWPIYHRGGCGKVAFYSLVKPKPRKTLFAEEIILINGTKPKIGKPVGPCGSCGGTLNSLTISTRSVGNPVKIK